MQKINSKKTPSIPTREINYIIPENSELQCPHFAECSGCLFDIDLASPPTFYRATSFFKETLGYQNLKLHAGPPQGWRHRARLAVRLALDESRKNQKLCVGLFEAGSHNPIDIPNCTVHHPALNVVADLIRSCIEMCEIDPYDETSGKGQLRYVQLALADVDQEQHQEEREKIYAVQVVLVWNAPNLGNALGLEDFAEALWLQAAAKFALAVTKTTTRTTTILKNSHNLGLRNSNSTASSSPSASSSSSSLLVALHSIHANFQPLKNNVILGPNTVLLHGSPESWTYFTLPATLPDTTTGPIENTASTDSTDPTTSSNEISNVVPIFFDPNSFMQANPGAMTAALQSMRSWIRPWSNVVDLHAGIGTIGIVLAATQNIASLRAVEINPAAEKPFWKSWKRLLKESSTAQINLNLNRKLPEKVEYFVAAAGSDPERWVKDAHVVIVDPPRKGLEPELLEYFCCIKKDGVGSSGGSPPGQEQQALAKRKEDFLLPERLIYLSCGFAAFERDSQRLVGSGHWKLVSAEAFLFFPGADHIETLAVFDRIISSAI